jgi:hypothetical protein
MPSGVGNRSSAFDVVEADDGNFDYNEKVVVEVGQRESRDFWIRPVGGVVNQAGPFHFSIDPMVDRYIQLNNAGLEARVRVVNADGSPLADVADIVAPVNLLGAVMWSDVEVSLNGQPFPGASCVNAGYKAFIETLLSYDSDARNTHISTRLFHLDSPGHAGNMAISTGSLMMAVQSGWRAGKIPYPDVPERIQYLPGDDEDEAAVRDLTEAEVVKVIASILGGIEFGVNRPNPALAQIGEGVQLNNAARRRHRLTLMHDFYTAHVGTPEMIETYRKFLVKGQDYVNKGFDKRYVVCCGSAPFDMFSPINHDFFKLNNNIGPGNRIDLKLSLAKHTFLLNSGLVGKNYRLQIDDLRLFLRTITLKERIPPPMTEKYLMTETNLHKQVVPAGLPNITFRIHNGGVMPKTVVVAMVYAKAADGNHEFNPFNFHHFNIKRMSLKINGEETPAGGLEFDFRQSNPLCSRAYHWIFENTGVADNEKGNMIAWQAFLSGSFIIPFDLTPDKCNGVHLHDAEFGFIDLTLEWDEPLPKPIYVLYENIFNRVLINDKLTNQVQLIDIEA